MKNIFQTIVNMNSFTVIQFTVEKALMDEGMSMSAEERQTLVQISQENDLDLIWALAYDRLHEPVKAADCRAWVARKQLRNKGVTHGI